MSTKAERRANRKSKKGRRTDRHRGGSQFVDYLDSDSASVTSSIADSGWESDGEFGVDIGDDDEFRMNECLEQLSEKRKATRVSALNSLNGLLTKDVQTEFVSQSYVTMSSLLASCLRKGAGNELANTVRAFSLTCITLGTSADGETFFHELAPVVERTLKTCRTTNARCAAVRALAIGCLSVSHELEEIFKYLELCSEFWHGTHTDQQQRAAKLPSELIAAALESWGLLASCVPNPDICRRYMNQTLPKLRRLLDHSDLEVRIASGANIALLYSAYYAQQFDDDDEEAEEMDPSDIEEVLSFLTKESSKSKAKKERKEQKAKFREILNTVETGEEPTQVITANEERMEFEGWNQFIQLAAFRNALQTGFQTHIHGNELLRGIFSIEAPTVKEDHGVDHGHERKNARIREHGEKSRYRDDKRKHGRTKKNAFLYADY